MTTTYDIARSIVSKLGGNPNNSGIVRAVAIWITYESGSVILGNNPLNMRPTSLPPGTCTKGVDSKNFIKFCTIDDATDTIAFHLNKSDWRNYDEIGKAIRAGSAIGMFKALAASPWSSDHYGGGSKLINAFNSGSNYNKTLTFRERGGGTSPGGGAVNAVADFWKQIASQLNIGLDTPLSEQQAKAVWDKLGERGIRGNIQVSDLVGKTLTQIAGGYQGIGPEDVSGALGAVGETIADAALTFTVVIIGLVFIIGAIILYRSSAKEAA